MKAAWQALGTVIALAAAVNAAQADTLTTYNVTETFYEPMTQPDNTIFTGTFTFDSTTDTISGLTGSLTESMTGTPMATVPLSYQLSSVSDGQGGELVSVFALNNTNVFSGGGFASGKGIDVTYGNDNAYATIDVNVSNPTAALSSAQLNLLSYADCTSGGLMGGKYCMTGIAAGGSMMGVPQSEVVTQAVPEPDTYALMAAGLGLIGFVTRRIRPLTGQAA